MSNNNNKNKDANIDIAEKILANVTSPATKAKAPEAKAAAEDNKTNSKTTNQTANQAKDNSSPSVENKPTTKIPAPFAKNQKTTNKAISPALNTANSSLGKNLATEAKAEANRTNTEKKASEATSTATPVTKAPNKAEPVKAEPAKNALAATPAKAIPAKVEPIRTETKVEAKADAKKEASPKASSTAQTNSAKEANQASPKVDNKTTPQKAEPSKATASNAKAAPAKVEENKNNKAPANKEASQPQAPKAPEQNKVNNTPKAEANKAPAKVEAKEASNPSPNLSTSKKAEATSTSSTANSNTSPTQSENQVAKGKVNKEGLEKTKEFLNQLIKDKEDQLMKNKDNKEALSKAAPKVEAKAEPKKEEGSNKALVKPQPPVKKQDNFAKADNIGGGNGGGNNNNTRYSSSSAASPKPQTSKTVALLLAVALALGGFAVYKMYEPSLFSQEDLDQAKPTYVTEKDFKDFLDAYNTKYSKLEDDYQQLNQNFNNYKHNTNSTLELLQIRLNIITNENYKSAFIHQNNKDDITPNFEFSKATNYKNTAGYKLLVDKFVTYENLDRIMGSIAFVIADKFRSLEEGKALGPVQDELYAAYSDHHHTELTELPTKNPEWEHQHQDAQGNVVSTEGDQNALAQHTIPTEQAPTVEKALTATEVEQIVKDALKNPEVKTYLGTLLADYALEHNTQDAEELVTQVTKATVAKLDSLLAPVNQQVNDLASNLAETIVTVDELSKETNAQAEKYDTELAKISTTLDKTDINLSELNKTVETNKDRLSSAEERLTKAEESISSTAETLNNTQVSVTNLGARAQAAATEVTEKFGQVEQRLEANSTAIEEANTKADDTQAQVEDRELIFTDTLTKFDVVLAATFLEQAQQSIIQAKPIANTIQKLKIAKELVISSEIAEAITTDINNLEQSTQDNGTVVKELLTSSLANIGALPDLDVTEPDQQSENLLENFKNAAGRFFSKFISVQKVENGYINSNANILIRENLRLSLENALASYQNNDKLSYVASLVRAEQILTQYYPKDNLPAQELLANVQKAKEVNFSIRDFKLTSLPLAIQDYVAPKAESAPIESPEPKETEETLQTPQDSAPASDADSENK